MSSLPAGRQVCELCDLDFMVAKDTKNHKVCNAKFTNPYSRIDCDHKQAIHKLLCALYDLHQFPQSVSKIGYCALNLQVKIVYVCRYGNGEESKDWHPGPL